MHNLLDDEFEMPESLRVNSPITDFFRDKCVFLTGGTGYLGYLFIEKLLRIKVKRLYIFIRPRRDKSATERLEEIFQSPVFKLMKKCAPDFRDHISIVEGDLLKENLGIDSVISQDLYDNVDIVIHSASDVRFNVTAYDIAITNVYGAFQLLEMCKNMKKLQAFLYVSTAFSQNREKIDDKFYPAVIEPETVIKYIKTRKSDADRDAFNAVASKFLNESQNPYMFSKGISEALVHNYGKYFPCAVIRPSIVYSTYRDPITAWNSKNSTLGLIISAILVGQLRCLLIRKNVQVPVVCADMVISASLSIIWFTSTEYNKTILSPQVYNFSNRDDDQYSKLMGNFVSLFENAARSSLSVNTFWYPGVQQCTTKWLYLVCAICYEAIPSAIIDFLRPNKNYSLFKLAKIIAMVNKTSNHLFRENHVFGYTNLDKIYERLTLYDKFFYNFNTRVVDWKYFMDESIVGLRAYVLDEPVDTIKNAQTTKRKAFWLKILHYTFKYSALIVFICLLAYFIVGPRIMCFVTKSRSTVNRLIFVNDGSLKLN